MPRRPAFTLLELLIIIAIMGLMATVGVVSVRSGQSTARLKGATRDIFAAIRAARSTALVSQMPVVVTYSVVYEDGEPVAQVKTTSAKLISSGVDRSKVRTLTGKPLKGLRNSAQSGVDDAASAGAANGEGEGESLNDYLFSPINTDVVKGMRLKVVVGDEGLADVGDGAFRRKRVSVFSNVDYLLGKFKASESPEARKEDSEPGSGKAAKAETAADESQEPVSVVWEANGRVKPHRVWVYADGKRPEDGFSIRIDSFGAAKVVSDEDGPE